MSFTVHPPWVKPNVIILSKVNCFGHLEITIKGLDSPLGVQNSDNLFNRTDDAFIKQWRSLFERKLFIS